MQKLVQISRTQDPSGRRLRENPFSLQGGGVGCVPKLGPETSLNFRGWAGGQVVMGGGGQRCIHLHTAPQSEMCFLGTLPPSLLITTELLQNCSGEGAQELRSHWARKARGLVPTRVSSGVHTGFI